MKGCTHIYFGDGKGKTTAAMGLAIRAAGSDKKVFIIQFLKGGPTGELIRQVSSHNYCTVFPQVLPEFLLSLYFAVYSWKNRLI